MADPSPIEFAELLGLTQGIDGPSFKMPPMHALELAANFSHTLHRLSKSKESAFFNQLAALYLPSLLQACLSESCDPYVTQVRWSLYQTAARMVCGSISFDRFIRNHPDDALNHLVRIIQLIAGFPDERRSDVVAHNLLGRLLYLLDLFIVRMLRFLPEGKVIPSIDKDTDRSLRRMIPWIRRSGIGEVETAQLLEHLVERKINILELRNALAAEGAYDSWNFCEIKARGYETSTKPPPCAEDGDGKVMDACSRCLTVRYCSREHQKLDWKRHKEFCFKPSW